MDKEKNSDPRPGGSKKKKEEKKLKRDPRSLENILKGLVNSTLEEKLDVLQEKYKEVLNELRITKTNLKMLEKQIETLHKDKEHTEAEHTKSVLARTKMEAIARELQKQNKDIKEENYNRLKEEEEKRKAVAANFTEKLNTLTTLMDENRDKSLRLREENLNMTSKLTELYNQFQDKEVSLANMNKQVELQKKLSETQLKKSEVEFEAEREVWAKERAMLLTNLERSEEANSLLQENIKALQSHIDSYQKQYCDFENTMQRSNKVFDTFKQEMQKLQKLNSDLEKDRDTLQSRFATSTQSILRLTATIEQKNIEYTKLDTKMQAMDSLCRRLLLERSAYIQQLRANNIHPITPGSAEDLAVSSAMGQPTLAFSAITDILDIPIGNHEDLMDDMKSSAHFVMNVADPKNTPSCEESHSICKRLEAERKMEFAGQEDSSLTDETTDELEDLVGTFTLDEQAQCFDRVPPLTLPPEIVAEECTTKTKGKSKKSGASIVKRGRESARPKDDSDPQEINIDHQQSDAIAEIAEAAAAPTVNYPTLKPYYPQSADTVGNSIAELKAQIKDLKLQLSAVPRVTGDQSLLPECDIGLATEPNVTAEQENVVDGSDEPESNIQEAKD